ncbi:unnamed protein product, partial [Prunus brigantina]
YISSYHFVDLLSHSSSYLLSNTGRQSWYVRSTMVLFFIYSSSSSLINLLVCILLHEAL